MNFKLAGIFMLALALCGFATSCKKKTPDKAPKASASSKRQVFQVKGVVHQIFPQRKQVKIEHEEIPGYMQAMTMDFDVKNADELKGLQPGDQIAFRMVVTEDDGWIESIAKTGVTQPVAANGPLPFRRVREVEPLKEGDLMPDYRFTNELGRVLNLSDYRGQAIGLTFLFTRCPFPTFCPRMAGNLRDASKLLTATATAPTNWHFFAVTIDPEFDTPAVLKQYGQNYDYDPAHWNFLTAEPIDITAIAEQFGLLYWKPDPKQPAGISHNLRTVVIDAAGRIQKIIPENKWEPQELVDEILKAASAKPSVTAKN